MGEDRPLRDAASCSAFNFVPIYQISLDSCNVLVFMNNSFRSRLKQRAIIEFLTNEGCAPKGIRARPVVQFKDDDPENKRQSP